MVDVSYPGVYIQEVSSGVHTITGVSTSIAAFFGRATKGPIDKAKHCLSFADFIRFYGARLTGSDLYDSVRQFFANGGTECYVVRLANGADQADLTLQSLDGTNVLVATAKDPGSLGNNLRLEVDYKTRNPDETFNLTVIQEDAGKEVTRETHTALSMDPGSSRFAPNFVTQSSDLIDLALHSDVDVGGATDLKVLANSFEGFSQSRVFQTTGAIAAFRTAFENLLTNSPKFVINVDESQDVSIDLSSVLGALPGLGALPAAWTTAQMAARIEQVINTQLNAVDATLQVTCSWETSGNFDALRITSDGSKKTKATISRASDKDFATPMLLGLDQGGIEPARYSNFRPVPTAAFFHDVDEIVPLAGLAIGDITSIDVDNSGSPVTFDFSTMSPASGDPWFVDSKGAGDGVREKLREIVKQVNKISTFAWKAELWGCHLAFIAKKGSINKQASAVVSAGDTTLGGANFTRNVRRYTLGSTGGSSFQDGAGTVGLPGTAPQLTDYLGNETDHTGFYALDLVDLFNLMIIPGDEEVSESTYLSLIGPASTYCEKHRAFLLIDAPKSWTKKGLADILQNLTKVSDVRSKVVKDHSAIFYPRMKYNQDGLIKSIGPSGAIAGLMARTDSTRGVWKAPAGVDADLRNTLGLEVELTDMENGTLNKLGVNCLRAFPSGFVNWGARTMDGSDDLGSEWKYIPIRRLALFLEESLFRGTKWVVFEPNDEPLWAKIRLNLNAFMMRLFRQGAFQGSSPDQAYYVKCDEETTPQADRDLGIVNIEVGFAPLKPAEFVVIKIQQIAGEL